MRLNRSIHWLLVGVVTVAFGLGLAQGLPKFGVQFQADMVTTGPEHPPGGTIVKMAVGDAAIRLEMAMDGDRMIMIMRSRDGQVELIMLSPGDKSYEVMILPASAALAMTPLAQVDSRFDARTSCARPPAGVRCTDLGRRVIGGRNTNGYRIEGQTIPGGPDKVTTWVDVANGLPLRTELPDGTVTEFRNLQVGPPPADLFRVPADYKRIGS